MEARSGLWGADKAWAGAWLGKRKRRERKMNSRSMGEREGRVMQRNGGEAEIKSERRVTMEEERSSWREVV